jgi:predicted aconitase with swiveling domain
MGWHHDLAADNARLIGAVLVFHCVCYRGSTLGGLILRGLTRSRPAPVNATAHLT